MTTFACQTCQAPVAAGSEACAQCGARFPDAQPFPHTGAPYAARGPRPTGVTVLAVLYFLAGAGILLVTIFMVLFGGFLGWAIGAEFGAGGAGAGLGVLIMAVFVLFAVPFAALAFIGGFGLMTGKKWAWYLALVLSGLLGVQDLARLVFLDPVAMVELAVHGLIVWYLFQDAPKRWFGVA